MKYNRCNKLKCLFIPNGPLTKAICNSFVSAKVTRIGGKSSGAACQQRNVYCFLTGKSVLFDECECLPQRLWIAVASSRWTMPPSLQLYAHAMSQIFFHEALVLSEVKRHFIRADKMSEITCLSASFIIGRRLLFRFPIDSASHRPMLCGPCATATLPWLWKCWKGGPRPVSLLDEEAIAGTSCFGESASAAIGRSSSSIAICLNQCIPLCLVSSRSALPASTAEIAMRSFACSIRTQ